MDYEQIDETQWKKTTAEVLAPLRAATSELLIQDVMRKVRVYGRIEEPARWPAFARWAIPALALSATSFASAFIYTVHPANLSTNVLLSEDSRSGFASEWASPRSSEDQLLGAAGEEEWV